MSTTYSYGNWCRVTQGECHCRGLHLGHHISTDDNDILVSAATGQFWRGFNMFMVDFSQIHSHIRCHLFKLYCCSYYGAPLWYRQSDMVSRLCVAWRKASRKIWRLSPRTHCDILPLLSDCVPLDISLKQRFMTFIQKAFNHSSPLISSISKLAMCNPWSRSASNYSEIVNDNNGRGTLCPSDIGNKWKANVSVARVNDVHILREMIEIRDGFKECCILSKE